MFLGNTLTKSTTGTATKFQSNSGAVVYDSKEGTLTVNNDLIDDVREDEVPSLIESEQIARNALKISGLAKAAGKIVLSSSAEDVLGGEQGIKKITARKFSFKQELGGGISLSQQGSIEVTVGAAGAIISIKAALLDVDSSFKTASRPVDISSRIEDIESQAIQHVATIAPGANYRVIKHRIGYDTGNFHQANHVAPAVIELTVEAAQGDFKRNYIEKIAL